MTLPDRSFADKCSELLATLQRDIRDHFQVEATREGCLIRTPYLFPDNDPIEVAVRLVGEGGRIRLSDAGETLGLLFLQGVDLGGKSKQEWHMATALRRLDVRNEGGELSVEVPVRELGDGLIRLVEAAKALSYLVYTARARTGPDFRREVAKWLEGESLEFANDVPIAGSSGRIWTDDFVREPEEAAPILMQTLHTETRGYAFRLAEHTALMWVEIQRVRSSARKVTLIDDTVEEPVWEQSLSILREYSDKVGLWQSKEELLEILAE